MNLISLIKSGKHFGEKALLTSMCFSMLNFGCSKSPIESSEPEDYVELSENTEVLNQNTLGKLTSVENGVLTFSEATTQSKSLKKDDIVICKISDATPNGFLGKINYTSEEGDTVKTTPACLEEAIESCNIHFSRRLVPDKSSVGKLGEGVYLNKSSAGFDFNIEIENKVLYDADKNPLTTDDQIMANGNISFNMNIEGDMNINPLLRLQHFLFEDIISENVQLDLNAQASGFNIDKEINVGPPIYLAAFAAGPVIFTPQIQLKVGLDGEVSISTASVTQEASLTAGIEYKNKKWDVIKDFSNDFDFKPPVFSGNADAKLYAGPQLSLLVYGITGPYVEPNAFLRGVVNVDTNPWWQLYGGLEAKVGAEADILGYTLVDYHTTAIEFEKLLSEAEGQFPWEYVELKNDDGSMEAGWTWGSAPNPCGNLLDGLFGWFSILTPQKYPFKLQKVKIYFESKHTAQKGFYLHVHKSSGETLLPTPFGINYNEIIAQTTFPGWWEKDLSDYEITIDSGKINVGICEKYIYCSKSSPPKTHCWSLGVDIDTEGGHSKMIGSIFAGSNLYIDTIDCGNSIDLMIRAGGLVPRKNKGSLQ